MILKTFKGLTKIRNRYFFVIDTLIFLITPFLAMTIRLDGSIDWEQYGLGLLWITPVFAILKLLLSYLSGFYRRCWRHASVEELQQIGAWMLATIVLQTLVFFALYRSQSLPVHELPRSLALLDGLLSALLIGGARFSLRWAESHQRWRRQLFRRERVLVVGAGNAGVSLVQEMQHNASHGYHPVAFIDDDPAKLNLQIRGIPVVGNRHQILQAVRSLRIRRIVIAMPSAPGSVIRDILAICQQTGVPTSTLPGLAEILNGKISLTKVRDVQVEDLLRREPIQMDFQRVYRFLRGKRVLITGSGGSIGSELCRQILRCRPAEILLLGHGENSMFNIQLELQKMLQNLAEDGEAGGPLPRISTFVADIRTLSRLHYAFRQFEPQVIFHAAAHKHVPMMEQNAPEAITNNVHGTKNLLVLAQEYNVEHFVMISTDKAVNPTNVMGASKRVAEMLVLQAAKKLQKPYVVVRFGNVLGSRGSVVPTFKQQIAEGGPVTVTHPEITRYFMTIPEAVQLVLQAATLGKGGEVFMLDMGQPVKIADLAREMIRLSGYEVGKDINIVFTGLRPGEKLYEELFIPGEQYERTQNEKLFIVANASGFVPPQLNATVNALWEAALNNDVESIVCLLKQIVPGYSPLGATAASPIRAMRSQGKQETVKVKRSSNQINKEYNGHADATPTVV